ncbi:MAG: DHH family phosphoesterase [Acutalibacteraceae bacterium]
MTRAEFCAFARAHDNFVILTHRRPDGDTIGSASALCLGLRQLGKTAFVLTNEQFTPRFDPFLDGLGLRGRCPQARPSFRRISRPRAFCPSMRCAWASRPSARSTITAAIPLPARSSSRRTRPPAARSSTRSCWSFGVTVTKRIAECLYVAISTDTGCFKFSNTTSNTHRTAAALIEAGADVYPINKVFFDTKSFSRLRMEAKLTETMEFYADGTVGVCVMPKRLLAEFSATEDDLDSISGFARSIEGVRIGVMIREVEDGLGKISLRTEAPYDAAKICRSAWAAAAMPRRRGQRPRRRRGREGSHFAGAARQRRRSFEENLWQTESL